MGAATAADLLESGALVGAHASMIEFKHLELNVVQAQACEGKVQQ